jgi:hypothetical protein
MDITQYNHIYPVIHDFNSSRSLAFTSVPNEFCSLRIDATGKFVSPYLYCLFNDERGNLFLAMNEGINTYTFTLFYNDDAHVINNVRHENIAEFIDRPADSSVGFFKFMDSQPARKYSEERCDAARNGPAVFLRDGQVPLGTAVNSLRPFALSNLEVYFSLLSVDGVGHLIYVKYFEGQNDSNEVFETNESDLPTASRSLLPALKLIIEWAEMTKEPWFSQEPVALAAHDFLDKIRMPGEVKNEIEENQDAMNVYRYLRGETNARQQPPVAELSEMKPLTRRWVKSKLFYDSVNHLYRNMFA